MQSVTISVNTVCKKATDLLIEIQILVGGNAVLGAQTELLTLVDEQRQIFQEFAQVALDVPGCKKIQLSSGTNQEIPKYLSSHINVKLLHILSC